MIEVEKDEISLCKLQRGNPDPQLQSFRLKAPGVGITSKKFSGSAWMYTLRKVDWRGFSGPATNRGTKKLPENDFFCRPLHIHYPITASYTHGTQPSLCRQHCWVSHLLCVEKIPLILRNLILTKGRGYWKSLLIELPLIVGNMMIVVY